MSPVAMRLLPAICGLLISASIIHPSHAQIPGGGTGVPNGPAVAPVELKDNRQAPPPGLPGARPGDAGAIPADRPVSEMSPNEALFDAINRGDIVNVRDAMSRGADTNSRNMLGLTPLDLSIDLSRNDITFLLLSLRGASPSSIAPNAARTPTTSATARPAPKPAAPAPQKIAAPAPRPTPNRLVNTDPGTPVPQAGFLGFGGVARP